MVKIRLKRLGNKFNPIYKIVAADARAPRDGRFIEVLGHYNPSSKELKLEKELILKWLNIGAVPTETVKTLLKKESILSEFAASKKAK
ncbi:30S ribosomal protein S16 [Mycoplasma sp. 480]|uniref:30S ribosomal protein S16 n=1 Tax=Mycoplasma sp. 480 TaxID=3440155 RepID=UPI003F51A495